MQHHIKRKVLYSLVFIDKNLCAVCLPIALAQGRILHDHWQRYVFPFIFTSDTNGQIKKTGITQDEKKLRQAYLPIHIGVNFAYMPRSLQAPDVQGRSHGGIKEFTESLSGQIGLALQIVGGSNRLEISTTRSGVIVRFYGKSQAMAARVLHKGCINEQ
ncbi:MAG: hypothetical protein GY874_21375 [Desulfobacteraceae bacterium]|nr:hypothetical protein [Desulfobacteraceae bacterium]